ncbi:hypothetical protein [Mariniblastus fucicola]|uniref:Bacterial type II and III secretion system protein n=1 Tax=Mariniblastus fucicola TaxID=980251 RepID=A0A5B9P1Z3_9BACT|nr:hypothetical protein [Mariniblastus fucicola]QEG20338.1 hypothetical protein MFFC18_01850 [Mariniblastus fucicola]
MYQNSIRSPRFDFNIWMIAFLIALPSSLAAQTQVPDQGRQNPSAWRPSFSPIDQSAASAQSQQTQNWGINSPTQGQPNSSNQNDRFANRNNSSGTNSANRSFVPQSVAEAPEDRPGVTRVTRTFEKLPNAAGQVWREYDITPYTSELPNIERPEQAVIDWIVKETGTRLWFSEPMGVLSADRKRVIVYHTPEIQSVVKSILDRFNRTRAQAQVFEINLVTVDKPNWRATAYPMLQPVEVRSPGIEAWLVSKENAAILQSQLARRADFKRHSGGRVAGPDGQTFVLEKSTPVSFVQALQWTPNQIPNYQPKTETINEGYRLALSCLTSLDNRTIEAIIDCDVDQVEKLTPVKVDVPAPGGALTQLDLNVPELISWRLNERVRWPSDQVLMLSCGIVASPEAKQDLPRGAFQMLSRFQSSKRTNALLFIEFRGPQSGATVPRAAQTSSGLVPIDRR